MLDYCEKGKGKEAWMQTKEEGPARVFQQAEINSFISLEKSTQTMPQTSCCEGRR